MKKIFRKLINNKGFTLVELIVVIAVLTIITAVVSPLMIEYVEKSRIGSDRNAAGEVGHAAEVVFVKKDKKDEVSFSIRISPKGKANYGGDGGSDFVASVAEIISPDIYIYKSKAYRGHTVNITVDRYGVAHVDENIGENVTIADKLGFTTQEGKDFVNGTIDWVGDLIGVGDLSEKLGEFIFDIETDLGAFDSLTKDEKEAELNKKGEELGVNNLGTLLKPILGDTTQPTDPPTNPPEEEEGKDDDGGCVATGTEILLADGSVKRIEELSLEDKILSFNHMTGEYTEADVLGIVYHGDKFRHVMNLEFSNGYEIKLIDCHDLFDITLNKYVALTNDNFMEYVGHEFVVVNENGYETVTLEYAFLSYEFTGSYAVFTDYYMNCFANGLLSNIAGAGVALNAFEFDSELKYDSEDMEQAIEKYGLYVYEDFAQYISEELFELLPFRYIKVCVERGACSPEDVANMLSMYSYYFKYLGEDASYINYAN